MRIVDRKFVDKTYTRLELNTSGLSRRKATRNARVVRMYPRLTISNLTEGLRNVYTNKKSEGSLRQSTLMQSNGESM
jgi:hypothetical protein